ncbi:hypothetical protein FPSE5266_09901 [Fusarium pseudograminearum]|nr:hypothetical protein FPSE5266_09901 [Fusarium pseudograminearum]
MDQSQEIAFYYRQPPGNIQATWNDIYNPFLNLYPYPHSSPVDTGKQDEGWFTAASNVPIFRLEPACTEIRLRKSDHLQFYFWTALERTNRLKRKDIWFYGDMCAPRGRPDGIWRRTLLSSPWFDCPIFDILLHKPMGCDDLDMSPYDKETTPYTDRDPCHAELEQMFMHLWWSQAVNLALRRFPNSDVVLPLTAKYYRKIYGDKAMEWPVINNETEEVGVMEEEAPGVKKEESS